jgi:hypothetical protein
VLRSYVIRRTGHIARGAMEKNLHDSVCSLVMNLSVTNAVNGPNQVQIVQCIQALRSVQAPSCHPPPRRGGGPRWGLERLERLEHLERLY